MPNWLNPNVVMEGFAEFMNMGGWVLIPIFITTFLMWTLIIERYSYYNMAHKPLKQRLSNEWNNRTDKSSWRARAVRDDLVSQIKVSTNSNVGVIKALVGVAPLLGLLGTVTGMINVFDVMALSGSSSARLMAGGVFQATIPTMAGMVSALSGLFFSNRLEQRSIRSTARFADSLELGDMQ